MLTQLVDRWRAALLVFGLALTVVWLITLILGPLYLLKLI